MPLPAARTLRPAVAAALAAALAAGAATAQAGARQGAVSNGPAKAAHAKAKRTDAKRTSKRRAKRQRHRTRSVAVRSGGSGWVPPALLRPRRTFGGAAAGGGAPGTTTTPGGGAPVSTPASPGGGGDITAPAPTRRTALGIRAQEFSLTFDGAGLTAGPLLVQLQNYGEDPHDLVIVRDGGSVAAKLPVTPARAGDAAPPGLTEATVDLPAGRYTLYCSLADHASRGMQAPLTVAP